MAELEKNLFYRYIFSMVLLIISLATSALVWGHWGYTLNSCSHYGYNCGCILYGTAYSQNFSGGRIEYCQYVTAVLIPIFIITVILIFYYGYRVLIKARQLRSSVLNSANRDNPLLNKRQRPGESVFLDSKPTLISPPRLWIRASIFGISMVILISLWVTAILTIKGYLSSCQEYRTLLVEQLGLAGNSAQVFSQRLTCFAIFDFLDYLQPDRKDFDSLYSYQRIDRINTGVTLFLLKLSLTMNGMNWIFITFRNFQQLRKSEK